MHKKLLAFAIALGWFGSATAQSNNNGQLDDISEFATKQTIPIRMPGGIELQTNIFLPITSDSMMVTTTVSGQQVTFELIPKGTQLMIYPTMINSLGDTVANPNPYQLPMVFTRSPYDKEGDDIGGAVFPFFGYAYAIQDMRGRYASDGVYMPMYSDSWKKAPYYNHNHLLDITATADSANGRFHEDGYSSYQYLLNEYKKDYDLNNDGITDVNDFVCNGSMGMFGASALGNSQYQLAAAHRIDTAGRGMKCLVPVVATNEHYNVTGYNNGVYRNMIASGWITGQLRDIDANIGSDNDIQNNVHTPFDFGLSTQAQVIDMGITHITTAKFNTNFASAYPNSISRSDMDASHAPVDALGEGDINGTQSRYTNMNVPAYHLTGWYDIFINGQIDTWKKMKANAAGSTGSLQKLVIGPWAHQTIGSRQTGDQIYAENVGDVIDVPLSGLDPNNLDLATLVNSELLGWYRYNLNERGHVHLGAPVVRIPESQNWQSAGTYTFRVPAADYDIAWIDMINFLGGIKGLPDMPVEVNFGFGTTMTTVNVPPMSNAPFVLNDTLEAPNTDNFKEDIADIRFYVVGPTDSMPINNGVGNYWYHTDDFPLSTQHANFVPYYLHQNGVLDGNAPVMDEGLLTYAHNPDVPVVTVGGANMIVRTPQDTRNSQGQMNYADTAFAALTMNNTGVIQFETAVLADTLSIIGFPKATLYAKSNPRGVGSGETDTDFFVRILDVYPDGREFNVVEGAVSARARAYAKSIYDGNENDTAAYSNINIDQWYEYQFEMLPIAYTFGRGHSMKVLISSGNFPRYQSNANVPIEQGDFFRRLPNDGQTYTYQGQTYSPRIADNSIAFSDVRRSRIELPVVGAPLMTDVEKATTTEANTFAVQLYPNPTTDNATISTNEIANFDILVYNTLGQVVYQNNYTARQHTVDLTTLAAGVYTVQLTNTTTQQIATQQVTKQ